ncbi:MAG TPA: protein kinase [Burkholderiales bacterium]|nr:protein kinase [Burkholderiales bacterium]
MDDPTIYRNALAGGTILQEYRIERVLGAGGFGVTYLARDRQLELAVAIKEYLPSAFAQRALDGTVFPVNSDHDKDFRWGLDRFIKEARTLALFNHPNIVRVKRFFELNGTGYMVMDYESGESFSSWLKRNAEPQQAQLQSIAARLLDGLAVVHGAGFLHRDIKPGNILVRGAGSPVLIDFGAARFAFGGAAQSLTAIVTPCYTPLEQYSPDGNQGPWSDLYALAGTLYRAVTRENPPEAALRLKFDAVPQKLATARPRFAAAFLEAIEWGMAVDEKRRPQSVEAWRAALLQGGAAAKVSQPGRQPLPAVRPDAAASRIAPAAAPSRGHSRRRDANATAASGGRSFWTWAALVALPLCGMAVGAKWLHKPEEPPHGSGNVLESRPHRPELRHLQPPPARADIARPAAQEPPVPAWVPRDGGARRDAGGPAAAGYDRPAGPPPAPPSIAQAFRSADSDGNGRISFEEARRGLPPWVARRFAEIDTDRDGELTPDELLRFKRLELEPRGPLPPPGQPGPPPPLNAYAPAAR